MTVAVAWIGVSSVFFGVFLSPRDFTFGVTLVALGLALCVGSLLTIRRIVGSSNDWRRISIRVLIIEFLSVSIDCVRLYFVVKAIGGSASFVAATALSFANVISTAVGIFPAGLGIREALSALVGVAAGLSETLSVTTAVADRIVVLLGLAFTSLIFTLSHRIIRHSRR
jgi:hypothetical protein